VYPRLEFGCFYKPAREVGGDYYDFIPFDSERLGLAVGDVSGKGLSTALLMASLQDLVRTNLAVRQGDVARFMTELNESYYKLTAANRYWCGCDAGRSSSTLSASCPRDPLPVPSRWRPACSSR